MTKRSFEKLPIELWAILIRVNGFAGFRIVYNSELMQSRQWTFRNVLVFVSAALKFRCIFEASPLKKFLLPLFFFPGTIFLCFTLNAFCTFFMLALKTFTIFQLIEKAHWVLLSAFGIFSLCFSTESTNKAISDCATLLNAMYSHDALDNINHKVEVSFNSVFLLFTFVRCRNEILS